MMMSGMMNIYMPLLIGYMSYTLASGLALKKILAGKANDGSGLIYGLGA